MQVSTKGTKEHKEEPVISNRYQRQGMGYRAILRVRLNLPAFET
jgi:hypothetical protein